MTITRARTLFFSTLEKLVMAALLLALCLCGYHLVQMVREYMAMTKSEIRIAYPDYTQFQNAHKATYDALHTSMTEEKKVSPPSPGDPEKLACRERLESIVKTILEFSKAAGQVRPGDGLEENIFRRCRSLRQHIPLMTNLDMLQQQLNVLVSKAEELRKLDRLDVAYYTWADFLEFYFDNLGQTIRSQEQQQREQEAASLQREKTISREWERCKALFAMMSLLVLFFVFLAIEKNTRMMGQLRDTLASDGGKKDGGEKSNAAGAEEPGAAEKMEELSLAPLPALDKDRAS